MTQSNLITLTKEEVALCLEFAKNFTSQEMEKSEFDFGNSSLSRNITDSVADSTTGKIGELAFKKYCKQFGFDINVDFGVRVGRKNIDFGQDVTSLLFKEKTCIPIPRVDVKTTKNNNHWLLLETHKEWASVVVMMVADLPHSIEINLEPFSQSVNCEYIGYAYLSDFYDANGSPWFSFKKGGRLLNPKAISLLITLAKGECADITLKSQLLKFYNDCVHQLGMDKVYLGPTLKCPLQIGLPRCLLRNSQDDFSQLVKILEDTSVSEEGYSEEMAIQMIGWTTHLSKIIRKLDR